MTKDIKNLKFENAWKYFEIHASQRISLFRYYIIFLSLYVTVSGYFIIKFDKASNDEEIIVILFSIIFILISIVFWLIDARNRNLIKYAEKSLTQFEKENKWHISHKIFNKEKKMSSKCLFKHTFCFRIIFSMAIISSIIIIGYSFFHITLSTTKCNIESSTLIYQKI